MSAIEEFGAPLAAPIRRLASDANAAAIVVALNATLASMKAAGVMAPDLTLAQTALALGATGGWMFGEPSGTVATAVVGSDGTYSNSPTLGSTGLLVGDAGTSVGFGGTKRATLPISGLSGDCSYFLVIHPTSLAACLFSGADLIATVDSSKYVHIYRGAAESYSNAPTAITANSTYSVVITRSAAGAPLLYVNGASVSLAVVSAVGAAATEVIAGWKADMSFAGTQQAFFVWNRILTAAEALLLHTVAANL